MTDEEFQTYVKSVITKLEVKDISFSEESARLSSEIFTNQYEFNRKEREIEELKKLKKEELF